MSTPVNDGGSAFPVPPERLNIVGDSPCWAYADRGMTLRDYFAGQALVGLLAHPSGEDPAVAVSFAYRIADAMLQQRAGKEAQP